MAKNVVDSWKMGSNLADGWDDSSKPMPTLLKTRLPWNSGRAVEALSVTMYPHNHHMARLTRSFSKVHSS